MNMTLLIYIFVAINIMTLIIPLVKDKHNVILSIFWIVLLSINIIISLNLILDIQFKEVYRNIICYIYIIISNILLFITYSFLKKKICKFP
ncbi:hypothetical protein C6H66_02430 [Photorhabdus hindustanensis]|uniref:Uncharacterized protein n=1 Tax=Photorhabdus hindustanensis TaxID=2918802 RepID=A0A2S8Q863_9GAMM|nr:hypothetical protein C6H66_02430 [Photorhabdus hindustanensis]